VGEGLDLGGGQGTGRGHAEGAFVADGLEQAAPVRRAGDQGGLAGGPSLQDRGARVEAQAGLLDSRSVATDAVRGEDRADTLLEERGFLLGDGRRRARGGRGERSRRGGQDGGDPEAEGGPGEESEGG
jgi:hypothetical protein